MSIPDEDIDDILAAALPQVSLLLRHEHGGVVACQHPQPAGDSQLAFQALGAKGSWNLGRAQVALGKQHVGCGERLLELAAEAEAAAASTAGKRHSRSCNTERPK